jgi:hypothetical protein
MVKERDVRDSRNLNRSNYKTEGICAPPIAPSSPFAAMVFCCFWLFICSGPRFQFSPTHTCFDSLLPRPGFVVRVAYFRGIPNRTTESFWASSLWCGERLNHEMARADVRDRAVWKPSQRVGVCLSKTSKPCSTTITGVVPCIPPEESDHTYGISNINFGTDVSPETPEGLS